MLDDLILKNSLAAAACALGRPANAADLKSKPQKGPLYTRYPAYPAARACIGHSAITEFRAQLSGGSSPTPNPATFGLAAARVDPAALQQTVQAVSELVDYRQAIDHLSSFCRLPPVESYCLFACSMMDRRFTYLRDVVCAALILGNLMQGLLGRPSVRTKVHPLTIRILAKLAPACGEYQRSLDHCEAHELPALGENLKAALIRALIPFLPPPSSGTEPQPASRSGTPDRVQTARNRTPPSELSGTEPLRGLDEVGPPLLQPPASPFLLQRLGMPQDSSLPANPEAGSSAFQSLVSALGQSLAAATQDEGWGEPRVDVVNRSIQQGLFKPGVMEDSFATQKHKVKLFGTDREELIAEEILPRTRNAETVEEVRRGAAPIERKLSRSKWFGNRNELVVDRFRSEGGLDPLRLHKIGTSPLLYRRWNDRVVADYRGEPLVVLAMDGSSSNTVHTSFAGQILTAAFLRISRLARIRVVAAEYSSGTTGPLVRWLYHPRKTPQTRFSDVIEVIASLPLGGQGCNHDVGSLSHIVRQVLPLAVSGQVYICNITDGAYNSPLPEVKSMIRALREKHAIVYSVVVLGDHGVDLPEANHVIHIPASGLGDSQYIADQIGSHVNKLVRDLRTKRKHAHARK